MEVGLCTETAAGRHSAGIRGHRGDAGRCWRGIVQNQPGASNQRAEAEHADYVDIPRRAAPFLHNERRIAAAHGKSGCLELHLDDLQLA